ncbi:GAF domain-containing protein [Rheinheimera sp. NSM]|uniref:GAF domain-containing protein n=1 Tax=Rheinheimera sp. NSM TaxID=3457884 RepID=UPI0040368113
MTNALAYLLEINRQIDPLQDITRLCQRSCELTAAGLTLPDNVIYLYQTDHSLRQIAAAGSKYQPGAGVVAPLQLVPGQGVVGTVAMQQSSLCIADTSDYGNYITDDATRPAELAVPICYQGELLGVIDAEHPQAGFFTSEHQCFLEGLAAMLAPRIANLAARLRLQRRSIHPVRKAQTVKPGVQHKLSRRLTEQEFSQQLNHWLKHYYTERQWQAAGLTALALLQALPDVSAVRIDCMKQLICTQIEQMQQYDATALWGRILHARYIGRRVDQLTLAAECHMAFSTLRRHQGLALAYLQAQLWRQELDARQACGVN